LETKALIASSDLATSITSLSKGITNNASYSFFKNFSTISTDTNIELIKKAIKKVKAFGFTTEDKASEIKLVILCKNDASIKDRIWTFKNGVTFLTYEGTIADKSGYVWVTLGNATKYIKILIDYSMLPTGIVLNNGAASNPLIFNPLIYEDELIENKIAANTSNISNLIQQAKEIANKNLRVTVAGSSITWGSGWLGQDSYVGKIEDYLLNVLANTKTHSSFTFTGTNSEVSNELFYKGKASLLTGINSEASITMNSDELSICIAKERGNDGASLVELYVDNVLYDTFSTENNSLVTGKNKNFTGTGLDYKYNLEEANTFNHILTVNGVSKVVQMNTQGYGATFPTGVDALIIRAIVTISGVPKVNHVLWFKNPPASGDNISLTYSCGENICYTKSTITQTGISLSSANESTYGDGATSFDTTQPSSISSGLDFRETNQDSILTYKFSEFKSRVFKLKIKSLSMNGSGTPKLYLNFVTDRIHFIQNAGIGGWTASALLTSNGLNTLEYIKDFRPDVVMLESCTNDDWSVSECKAYKTVTGLTDASTRAVETSLYYNNVSLITTDNYTVQDVRINILSATRNSITIDSTSTILNISTGDILNMGRYNQDAESIITRIVKTYNSTTKVITFDTPLSTKEITKLSNSYTIIRGLSTWETTLNTIIDGLRNSNKNIKIAIATSGNTHFYHRRLNGYSELAKNIALNKNVSFIDFWRETYSWEKTQVRNTKLYLNASSSSTSTGVATYTLYLGAGTIPVDYFLRNLSVKVNGVERLGNGCFVTGGKTYNWDDSTTNMTASNRVLMQKDFKLEFTSDIPASGAVIDISFSSNNWSSDNTHPNDYGKYLFSKAANSFIRECR
jgi:hypothetical protein